MVPRLRSQLFVSRLDQGWWRYLLSPFFVCYRLISNVRNFPLFWLAWFSMYLHWKWFRIDGDSWYLGDMKDGFWKVSGNIDLGVYIFFYCRMAYYDLSLWRWVNLQISSYGGWYQWQITLAYAKCNWMSTGAPGPGSKPSPLYSCWPWTAQSFGKLWFLKFQRFQEENYS